MKKMKDWNDWIKANLPVVSLTVFLLAVGLGYLSLEYYKLDRQLVVGLVQNNTAAMEKFSAVSGKTMTKFSDVMDKAMDRLNEHDKTLENHNVRLGYLEKE